MEILTCSALNYAEKSCHSQEKSVMDFTQEAELNRAKHDKPTSPEEKKADHSPPSLEVAMDTMLSDDQGSPDGIELTFNENSNEHCRWVSDSNDQKLSGDVLDQNDGDLEEQVQFKEACFDFQNSHVDVNTIDSEPFSENKEEDLSISASEWPEHDEPLPLWVKWRGKWQAGIKCERADWPLATVKAKPTHDRKSYIVIFFPHKKNYSWADTMLVCAIDELPQPIAHRSHKVGVQLVEDLTVARRFIMKMIVIGILNVVDQLPFQVLVDTARDLVVWREFAEEASRCKSYPDLGRLLLKLGNMLLQQYMDANWVQHSFHHWVDKCQNAFSADSIELLKEELVSSILWSELNSLRDTQGQPALGCEWKMWKQEVMKTFSVTHSVSGGGSIEQPSKRDIEQLNVRPSMTSLQISRKRPKLEVRRAEPHSSVVDSKNSQEDTILQIDSAFFASQSTVTADISLTPSKEEFLGQETAESRSPNAVDGWNEIMVDTSNTESTQKDNSKLQPANGVVETKSTPSKVKNKQCIAFIEAKGRQCVRWANDGDDYCCVHVTSRFVAHSAKPEVNSSVEASASMCQGTTTQGTRCKHRALSGISFCKKHRSNGDGKITPCSPGNQLEKKHDDLVDKSEHTSKNSVMIGEPQRPLEEHLNQMEGTASNAGKTVLTMPGQSAEDSNSKNTEIACCVGLGMGEDHVNCLESPKRHSLYCDKHIPSWLKRARNGKSRIISKEVFVDLLKTCSSHKQKMHLHQACELFYKLLKSILSFRNQVPKEIQLQWALSEASKDSNVAELLMKLVFKEKEKLTRIWGFNPEKDAQVSCSAVEEQALLPAEEKGNDNDDDGTFNCKICSVAFHDDQTLGTHWIDSHNKEAQWLFRGYACAICLDSFTNRKVLETHVQERHHAQFVEHCMLIQCIPCGSHFGNSEELWSHVLSAHTDGFRQSKRLDNGQQSLDTQQKPIPLKPLSVDNSESQSSIRKFICRFCGLRFDLLPDLGRHHQAAHMGPGLVNSRPKKKGLRFYSYRLKSGRLSRPRFKKGLGASYRLRNKGNIVLKKQLQPVNPIGAGGVDVQTHVIDSASVVNLTKAQCSAIAKMLSSEAQKTRARPSNHEIISIVRSACCKISVQSLLEKKYGELPERLFLKAAKLGSENNASINWHQEGFTCPKGCKPLECQNLGSVMSCPINERGRLVIPSSNAQQEECEMDECHFVIRPQQFRWRHLQTTIILSEDISFGQERIPVPCVVDKHLIDSLHYPTYGFDGQVIFMPWESFTYATKPLLDKSLDFNMQNLQLGCGCSQSTCSPETCDHVYLFNNDYEYAKDIDGKLMKGRFPYDFKGRLLLEDKYLVYECNQLCKCSSECPNRVLQNGVRVKMEVFKTEKKGWAVRACQTILRGTFVCEYVGEVLDEQEASRRRKRKEGDYFYDMGIHLQHVSALMEGQAKYVIDALRYGNVSRFINHSCCPNLGSHLVLVESMDFQLAHVGFYAKQDIAAGEELCFDYHSELQAGDGCSCLCGASGCRGRLH